MSIHAGSLVTMARLPVAPISPRAPLAEATLVPLGSRLLALFFDRRDAAGRARTVCEVDGRPLPPPFAGTDLEMAAGGRRHVLLLGRCLEEVLDRRILLVRDGAPVAGIEPGWLQPPVADAPALIAGLGAAALRRLFKLLLTTGASLLAPIVADDLARAALRLLQLCGVEALTPVGCAAIGRLRHVLSYRLPGTGADPAGEAVLLSPGRVPRATGVDLLYEATLAGRLLHLCLPRPVPHDAELILLGKPILRLSTAASRAAPLPTWAARRGPAVRAWARGLAADAVCQGRASDGLLRELREGAAAPALSVKHLSATVQDVVHALDLCDPDRLVRAVWIERGEQAAAVEPHLRPNGRGTLAGVVPLGGDADGGEPCRVRLTLHSGATRLLHEEVLRSYDGAIPPGFAEGRDEAASVGGADPIEALARVRLALAPRAVHAAAQTFGAPRRRPRLSVVADASDNPDIARARAALIAREGGRVEVVCVAAEGPAAAAARCLAAEAAAVLAVPHRVVAVTPEASPADRLRLGLAHAQGDVVMWLGPDVLPARDGWLASWMRRLGAAGCQPALVGSIVDHDGGEAAGTQAGCVGFTRAGVGRLLALPLGHPDPAVLIAAACPDSGTFGGLLAAAVRYGPAPREDRTEADLRASALDLLRRGVP